MTIIILLLTNVLFNILMVSYGDPMNITVLHHSQMVPKVVPKKVPATHPVDLENLPRLDTEGYLRRTGDQDQLRHSNPLERDPTPPIMAYPTRQQDFEMVPDTNPDDTSNEATAMLKNPGYYPIPPKVPQGTDGLSITITPLVKAGAVPAGIGYGIYGGIGTNLVPQYTNAWKGIPGAHPGYYASGRVPGFPRAYPGKYGYFGLSFRPVQWYPRWYPTGKYPGWYPTGKYPGWYPPGKRPGGDPGRPGTGDGGVGPPGSGRGDGGTFGGAPENLDTFPTNYGQNYDYYY